MSDQLDNRSYDNFSRKAIYNSSRKPTNHDFGWEDEYFSDDNSTPINADNLNAMLQMLIDIRNVIGKTTDFAYNINGEKITQPDTESNSSVATYIEEVADAIIGSGDDESNTSIKRTISGLKKYLEELDAQNITYTSSANDINIKDIESVNLVLQTLDKIIGDLSEIKYSENAVSSVSEALTAEKEARETSDNDLQKQVNKEVSDRENAVSSVSEALKNLAGNDRTTETVKANADAIAAINNDKTGIKATIIGTDDDTATSDTINGAKKYTYKQIEDLRSLILEGLDEINCGTAAEFIDNGGTN